MNIRFVVLLFLLAALSPISEAQSTFENWIASQIQSAIDKKVNSVGLDKETVGQNGKGTDRQKESPSADSRSTSLVDQSSASDFFSVAANIIPVTPGLSQFTSGTGSTSSSNPSATGSTTATASLFALLAAFNKTSPTDPSFYAQHVFSRRLSFTVGTAASEQATDNTTTPATVYGTKFLLINKRELYTKKNLESLRRAQKAVSAAAVASASLEEKIKELMFATLHPTDVDVKGAPNPNKYDAFITFITQDLSDANFQNTINSLPARTKKDIQTLIESSVDDFSNEQAVLKGVYDNISKGMQMSASYAADIRDSKGNNNHRGEFIFDYGISDRINWTVNASADYTDRKMALDSKGGRVATEFQGDLTKSNSAWGRSPIRLSFSGEAQWLTRQKPQYTFQAKLAIPLSAGIELPIVYKYANRTALLNQTDSEARLGLSIDVSRLAQALK
jgi:hypothetical protein